MAEIADAEMPFVKLEANHRVDKHGTPRGLLRIDFVTYVETEEWIESAETSLKLATHEDRDKRAGFEIPALGDAETRTEANVGMHFAGDAALNVESGKTVACLNGLKLQEGLDGLGTDEAEDSQDKRKKELFHKALQEVPSVISR